MQPWNSWFLLYFFGHFSIPHFSLS
jgi:hypothetical protein